MAHGFHSTLPPRIVASGELRLYWVRKRIDQGELDTFARKHALKGYLATDKGEAFNKMLSDDIYYISLTRPGLGDETDLWNGFGKAGRGVRLEFRIDPGYAELRSIQYEALGDALLGKINSALASDGVFIPWALSKIGAFYLPSSLQSEGEVRLLIKRHAGGRDDSQMDEKARDTGHWRSALKMTSAVSTF